MSGAQHVVPRNDLIEHDASDECACGPDAAFEPGGVVYIHHSLDGREASERNITEREILAALHDFYGEKAAGARRFAIADHPDANGRIADFVAIDAWTRDKHAVIGHEIKVSRSDWLAELRRPQKADAWKRYCRRWWLVVPDQAIVRDDLPDGWGLMLYREGHLSPVVPAKPLRPEPMPWPMTARLMRSIAQTCERIGSEVSGD